MTPDCPAEKDVQRRVRGVALSANAGAASASVQANAAVLATARRTAGKKMLIVRKCMGLMIGQPCQCPFPSISATGRHLDRAAVPAPVRKSNLPFTHPGLERELPVRLVKPVDEPEAPAPLVLGVRNRRPLPLVVDEHFRDDAVRGDRAKHLAFENDH